jgi:hypothetical protein
MRILEWFSTILVSICFAHAKQARRDLALYAAHLIHRKGTPPTQHVNLADPWTGPSL